MVAPLSLGEAIGFWGCGCNLSGFRAIRFLSTALTALSFLGSGFGRLRSWGGIGRDDISLHLEEIEVLSFDFVAKKGCGGTCGSAGVDQVTWPLQLLGDSNAAFDGEFSHGHKEAFEEIAERSEGLAGAFQLVEPVCRDFSQLKKLTLSRHEGSVGFDSRLR